MCLRASTLLSCCILLVSRLGHAETVIAEPPEDASRIPEGILIWVIAPMVENVGTSFVMEVRIENAQSAERFTFEDIDVAAQYMKGFELLGVIPQPSETSWHGGDLSLTYSRTLEPGESFDLQLRMRPKRAGVYIGDVDVWFGSTSYTRVAQPRILTE